MLRKLDKIPSVKDTVEYSKEYKGDNTNGGDCLATGVTAGVYLVQQAGVSVTACIFVVKIRLLNSRGRVCMVSINENIQII
ncbi:hypothetical protein Plhal304r1_c072g0160841 [Plasmopara halstedii]